LPFDDRGRSTMATLEARALAGEAGASLRALVRAAGARRLERVEGWPIGAVAIGDTVYVNAAWLVALAPETDGGTDAGTVAASLPSALPAMPVWPAPVATPEAPAPDTPTVARTARPLYQSDPDGGTDPEDPPASDTDTTANDAC